MKMNRGRSNLPQLLPELKNRVYRTVVTLKEKARAFVSGLIFIERNEL